MPKQFSSNDVDQDLAKASQPFPETPLVIEPHKFEVGNLKFYAFGDRVIVQEDEFKSGYECSHCGGSGNASCGDCGGTGTRFTGKVTVRCPHCENGAVTCPECKGKGGLIVTPETAERRPTTGKVVSAGPNCRYVHVGESVMYSSFAGYQVDLKPAGRHMVLCILHETELLCGMEGQLQLRNYGGKNEITQYAS